MGGKRALQLYDVAMKAQAVAGLLFALTNLAPDRMATAAPYPQLASRQNLVLAPECEQARSYIVGLRSTGSVVRWNGRSGVVLQRRKWDRLTPDDQSKLIWSVAKATTCSDGQIIHLVRITDTGEKILRVQKVSLDPQCHGDTVNEAVWYRC